MKCPTCDQPHRGPRDLEAIHQHAGQVLARAAEMPMVEASRFLRVCLLAIGLELSGLCPSCVLQMQAEIALGVSSETIAHVRSAEEAMQAASAGQLEMHVCKILPFRPPVAVPDFAGRLHDNERK